MACTLKKIKRDPNDLSLHHRIIWLAAGVAEGKVSEHEPGNAALLDDIFRRADYYSRNSTCLEVSRYQTHGLMADRSKRYEERCIDRIGSTEIENRGGIRVYGPTLAEVR
jgi:hypothetical protein